MSEQTLFIPNKINVGFQKRSDTYTGKLAYVIYYDQLGRLRKEKSWQGWRDKKIPNEEFQNEPTEGFVLNKDVGGARRSYGWNCRNEYVRVYDPRDFEFEISIANLLFILRECDCSRGIGLEGRFVYGWQGTELVHLPTNSVDYQSSQQFTALQAQKISAKDLIPGATYMTKSQLQDHLIYLGRFDRWRPYDKEGYSYGDATTSMKAATGKVHVFQKPDRKDYEFLSSVSKLGAVVSDTPVPDLAERIQKYYMSKHGSKVVELFLEDPKSTKKKDDYYSRDYLAYEEREGSGIFILYSMSERQSQYMTTHERVQIKDNVLCFENYYTESYPPGCQKNRYWHRNVAELPWVERKPKKLWALLESGAKFAVTYNGLQEK